MATLQGRTVVIIGGTSGMGFATAQQLLAAGANVGRLITSSPSPFTTRGTVGQPAETAHAVQFLMNTFTTGIKLRVDGGALLT